MSDLGKIFDSAKGEFSPRLFTPQKIYIKKTDSLESLVNELSDINRIYLSDFNVCCDELKNNSIDDLVQELYILSDEQVYNLRQCYNLSTCKKDLNLKKNVSEAIHKIDTNYRNMILSLYLDF